MRYRDLPLEDQVKRNRRQLWGFALIIVCLLVIIHGIGEELSDIETEQVKSRADLTELKRQILRVRIPPQPESETDGNPD